MAMKLCLHTSIGQLLGNYVARHKKTIKTLILLYLLKIYLALDENQIEKFGQMQP